jgi:hypothetical protein
MNSAIQRLKKPLLLIIFFYLSLGSCRKDDFNTDGNTTLNFSADEILFDTVFTSVGSVTKNLKVYNPYNQPIKTNIRLAGSGINFRINVNGQSGRDFRNVEIRAKDSLWIFIEVTVDPTTALLPFVIADSIIFETNGNFQDVDLRAWGQNAHFIVADNFPSGLPSYKLLSPNLNASVTWDSTLPYVIYGYLAVDSSQTLTIEKGTHVHFYNNSGLWIYKGGTLNVNGELNGRVVFEGTRRESDFEEEPNQWDRIWLNNGATSTINYAIIKNGFIGIQCDVFPEPAAADMLKLSNTFIRNMSGAGIFASDYTIKAWNNVITNCGNYACALMDGGGYNFNHCTIGNYWGFQQRSTPSLYINNYIQVSDASVSGNNLDSAFFANCIIDGKADDELDYDSLSGFAFNYKFSNCLIKATQTSVTGSHYTNICKSCDADFVDRENNNYELGNNSSAINAGDQQYIISGETDFDFNGTSRLNNLPPDLGAYEKH